MLAAAIVDHLLADLAADARAVRPMAAVGSHRELHDALGAIGRELRVRRPDLPVHAAFVVDGDGGDGGDGGGVLIAGTSGCGKSTLALALALDGAVLVSDDSVWLADGVARGWGAPLAVRRPGPWSDRIDRLPYATDEPRVLVSPADLDVRTAASGRIAVVVFPEFAAGAGTRCEAVSPGRAFCELAAAALRAATSDEFLALAQLAARIPAASIGYGDVPGSIQATRAAMALAPPQSDVRLLSDDEATAWQFGPDVGGIAIGAEAVLWNRATVQVLAIADWPTTDDPPGTELFEHLRALNFVGRVTAR